MEVIYRYPAAIDVMKKEETRRWSVGSIYTAKVTSLIVADMIDKCDLFHLPTFTMMSIPFTKALSIASRHNKSILGGTSDREKPPLTIKSNNSGGGGGVQPFSDVGFKPPATIDQFCTVSLERTSLLHDLMHFFGFKYFTSFNLS